MTLPSTSPIVIIGGGVMGASALYHLAKRGVSAVLLEKESFFGLGATGRCAGGIARDAGGTTARRRESEIGQQPERAGVDRLAADHHRLPRLARGGGGRISRRRDSREERTRR